jgi:hypothetical protein
VVRGWDKIERIGADGGRSFVPLQIIVNVDVFQATSAGFVAVFVVAGERLSGKFGPALPSFRDADRTEGF